MHCNSCSFPRWAFQVAYSPHNNNETLRRRGKAREEYCLSRFLKGIVSWWLLYFFRFLCSWKKMSTYLTFQLLVSRGLNVILLLEEGLVVWSDLNCALGIFGALRHILGIIKFCNHLSWLWTRSGGTNQIQFWVFWLQINKTLKHALNFKHCNSPAHEKQGQNVIQPSCGIIPTIISCSCFFPVPLSPLKLSQAVWKREHRKAKMKQLMQGSTSNIWGIFV